MSATPWRNQKRKWPEIWYKHLKMFYQNPLGARIFLFALVYVFMYLFVFVERPGQTKKRYKPRIWYTRSPSPHLKTGCLFFTKEWPRGPPASKAAVYHGFSTYLYDCLVFFFKIIMTMRAANLKKMPSRVHSRISPPLPCLFLLYIHVRIF